MANNCIQHDQLADWQDRVSEADKRTKEALEYIKNNLTTKGSK